MVMTETGIGNCWKAVVSLHRSPFLYENWACSRLASSSFVSLGHVMWSYAYDGHDMRLMQDNLVNGVSSTFTLYGLDRIYANTSH